MRGKKRRPRRFRWGSGKDHPRMCGEKSRFGTWLKCASGSPPHMRGKAGDLIPIYLDEVGSPPHMRGKAEQAALGALEAGITPAYAGKRRAGCQYGAICEDHPRICGEKLDCSCIFVLLMGSPPHMRGKGPFLPPSRARDRITPAYAGKRRGNEILSDAGRDHPRICGEKRTYRATSWAQPGSPPRMRGKAFRAALP